MKRFWRWLTCGHGHHAMWRVQVAVDLGLPPRPDNSRATLVASRFDARVARTCSRCDLTEILE